MFDKTVEVKVGSDENQKSFTLHQGLLCHYSGFFEAALKGAFAEAKNNKIELKDEDPETFERFLAWLYTRRFHRSMDKNDNFTIIAKLWVLADRRQIPLLSNAMIDAMRDEIASQWTVPTADLHYLYQNTTASSGLRQLIVYAISNTGGPELLVEKSRSRWPPDALWDVARTVWKLKEERATNVTSASLAKMDMCRYHQHEDGVTCSTVTK